MSRNNVLKTLVWSVIFMSLVFPRSILAANGKISLAAVGDCLIFNKVSIYKDPGFLKLVDILRGADCAYGNCETTFLKPEGIFPAYKALDPNVFCYPWGADEIKWLGIDLMSLANNHIMDFDYNGLFATLKHLDRAGIVHAGAGKDLHHASRPGYFETERGPVALVSCSSWIPEKNHQATLPHYYMKGKPGLNPLEVEWRIQLDGENFARINALRDQVFETLKVPFPREEGKEVTRVDMLDNTYVKGDKIELKLVPNQDDLKRILESIKIAKRNARIVMVSLHEHLGLMYEKAPSRYQEDFARSCIDAGADVFVCTGPHELWGIEMYKGKPIFHSLGNFFFQGPLRMIAPEAYERIGLPRDTRDPSLYEEKFDTYFTQIPIWDSVVPVVTFDGDNRVKEIKLHPIYLDGDKEVYMRGTPRLASPQKAGEIIDRLNKMSERYQTRIILKKGVGRIIL